MDLPQLLGHRAILRGQRHDDVVLTRLEDEIVCSALRHQQSQALRHGGGRDPEVGRSLAIDHDVELRILEPHVAVDVDQLRQLAQAIDDLSGDLAELLEIGARAAQGDLDIGGAEATAE